MKTKDIKALPVGTPVAVIAPGTHRKEALATRAVVIGIGWTRHECGLWGRSGDRYSDTGRGIAIGEDCAILNDWSPDVVPASHILGPWDTYVEEKVKFEAAEKIANREEQARRSKWRNETKPEIEQLAKKLQLKTIQLPFIESDLVQIGVEELQGLLRTHPKVMTPPFSPMQRAAGLLEATIFADTPDEAEELEQQVLDLLSPTPAAALFALATDDTLAADVRGIAARMFAEHPKSAQDRWT